MSDARYLATEPIPELGAEPGDTIVVDPDHHEDPVLVVKGFGREELVTVASYLDTLEPAGSDPEIHKRTEVRLRMASSLRVVR